MADMPAERFEFAIRIIMVTWRDAMRHVRAGDIPESRESIQRVTHRALALLSDLDGQLAMSSPQLSKQLSAARGELDGAIADDPADSGEIAG